MILKEDKLFVIYNGDNLQHGEVQVQNYQSYLKKFESR